MSAAQLIQKLGSHGIKLWLDDGQLKFKAPKGALTVDLKSELIENKAAVIEFLSTLEAKNENTDIQVVSRDAHKAYPLSFSQQRFWFLDQLQSGDASLNIPAAIELRGVLSVQALEQAFNALISRHESLRTYFSSNEDNRPQQYISESLQFKLQEDYDLSHLDDESMQRQLQDIAKEEALKSFNLKSGESQQPLFFRCKLARLSSSLDATNSRAVLFITLHHIICDGLSLNVLIKQLAQYYSLIVNGIGYSELNTAQTLQYIDYSQHQLHWMQSKKMVIELDWWKQQLKDSSVLQLPYDFSRPLHVGHHGSKKSLKLSTSLSQSIRTYAADNKTSHFIFLLTAFQILLNKYSKQIDFCIGTPIHGRSQIELEDAVGCFINLLAIPCQLNSNVNTVPLLIKATHDFFMQAQDNQTIPFDVLAEEIDYERSAAHTPLFQVLFTQQTQDVLTGIDFSGLQLNALEQGSYTSKYDLQLHVNDGDDGIDLSIEFNLDLFLPETIEMLLRHFSNICSAMVENNALAIQDIEILDEVDFLALNISPQPALIQNTESHPIKHRRLIESFDAQCQATPNAIAIDDGVDTLIYQQVFDDSLTLANTLQSKGLRAGDKVGLCFSPNQYAVTSLFACLRLSLCYVPMDVNHPVERLRFIAEDANLSLLLTQKTIAEHIALQDIQSCLFVDSLGALDREFVPNTITSEQENTLPLYVIYTSGSTGSPKGAMVSYANEKHLLDWYISEYEIDASSKTLIISSLGFDLTQKNLFAPLLTGGAVYFTASDVYDPIDILACIERQQINRINCAPSAFYPIVAAAQRTHHLDYLSHLSYVLLGGEPIVMAHLSHWLSNSGKQVQLVNMYGPTECTDISCAYTVEDLDVHSIPIGYAIPGIECLVLDEHLNVLPVGMSGELYIGGESLGLGYLNNESLNDEAFITHPLDKNKNIYRSRDIVRYVRSSKGLLLEFIARADDQVKIRGFRIELGEITNQLLAQDGIKEAAVVVSPVDGQDKLVAYLALDSADTLLNLHDLRQSLKQYLPDYMLPNAFVELEALPISANGKIDKKQLPAVTEHDFLKREYVSARNLIEAQLVDIWQDILQIENLSVYDNFFEIGGHSLLATQMIAAVADEFAIEIPLKVFFDQPTIAQCAEAINSGELVEVFSQQHPIVVVDRNRELPLSFSQERLWVIEQINPNNSAYNIPAALSLEGKLDVDAIEKTLCAIVNRHESLRTYFGLGKDGSPIQIIANKDKFTLTKIDISSELQPMQVAQKLFDDDAATPFDISSDTLFRAMLLKLSNNKYVLVATMHHIISDGWSINVLQKELVTHYAAFRLKEAVDIEALPFQYADFSVWQREQLSDDHIQSHLNFWRQELKGSPAHITLPNDKPRPSQQTFNGAVHKLTFNTSAVNKLKAFSQLHGITPFTTLLTSYALMLSKYAKQDDICIGTPVAGREQKSLESLIGYFVNAVVLRCQLDGNPSFSQLLSRLQDTSLMAFANQSVPLEKVLEVVEVERNPAYSPVSQVGFSYIGQEFTVKAKLPDLEVNYLDFNRVVAKYDLTLIVIDDGESISCEFEYNSDLFLASTIQVYAKAFEAIFTQAIDSPQLSVKQLLQLNFQQRCAAIEVNEELVERVLPLTSMQQDMVFSQLISPASLANTLGYRAEVEVDINPELWQKAFQLVTNNQSICRTVFKANKTLVGDDYYQCVLKQKGVDVELIDLRNQQLSESDVDRSVNEFIYQPLAYQQERFMRIGVLKYDGRDILLLSSHHALLDGVSIVLIAQATAAYYEQLINGGDVSQVPSLPETFDAYIEKDLSLTDTRTVKDFWENTLLPCEPLNYTLMNKSRATKTDSSVLESFPHQSKTVSKGLQLEPYHSQKIQALAFSVQHWQSIKTYCRSNKITPPQYFKLLYSLLISQYCCANHTFSMTEFSAGRDRSNALSLGCFFKQAPFVFEAGELSKDTSLNELFKTQRAFRKLIKGRSDISASLSSALQQPSTLQFMFNYYHFFPAGQTLQGKPILCIEMPPFIENTVQFIVKEQSDSVSLDLYFQDTVFDDIDFLQRLEMLSAQLVQHAEQLKQLSYLLPIEFIQQVYQWNKVEPSKALVPLAKQFEQQVSKHPEKVALDDGFETLTYAALNQRANVLAHQLQALGVGANVRVAFCLPRNTDAISIILAVIKLGACYVPIDANYPSERIALIIEASKAKFLFVARGSTLVGQHFESQTFEIFQGDIDGLTANHSSDNLSIEAHVDDSLYIIFTSGSTGTPKGAAISYANEINLMLWYTSFDFEESTACVFSPLGFDLTQKNLLAPLLSGGKLVLIGGDYDSEKILNTIETHHVTHINCAPSLFYPLVEDYDALRSNSALSHLICVSFGGEPIQINRLQPWLQSDSFDCQLYNHYGPTECTDIALFHAIDAEAALRSNYIPLGKPNVGVQTYIMNERLQLLPAGVTGEICIAGRGVGLTYINDELLNLDKFVANPLGAGKLYRTGDLGRYDSQFDIEFIGRKDHQLKLNGLRIEPGEIEFQLEALEQIQGAIVQVADEQLVAYILTETVLELADIQLSLSEYLPSYMLPKHVVCLGQWPLTANGKIDRAKLPIPSEKSSVEYTAPATEIEKDLCQILEHILQVQRVGIHDNFFDLGGHSLAASRAIVQVRQKYEIDIPLNVLFELSTVEKLAAWISASQWAMQSAQMQDDENEEDSGRDSGFI